MQVLGSVGELEPHVCAAGEHECCERANRDREPLDQLHRPPPSFSRGSPALCPNPPGSESATFGGHRATIG